MNKMVRIKRKVDSKIKNHPENKIVDEKPIGFLVYAYIPVVINLHSGLGLYISRPKALLIVKVFKELYKRRKPATSKNIPRSTAKNRGINTYNGRFNKLITAIDINERVRINAAKTGKTTQPRGVLFVNTAFISHSPSQSRAVHRC